MAGPGKGGRNVTNVPKLQGAASARPAGSSAVVPNAQYPTVLGTKRLPGIPGPVVTQGGIEINEPGDVTVNSTPAK
jgi:hypothetical protein